MVYIVELFIVDTVQLVELIILNGQDFDSVQMLSKYSVGWLIFIDLGTGEGSEIIHTRTKGSGPTKPEASKFLEPSSNSVTLHLGTFSDGGCPMLYFVVEYKIR